MPAENLTPMQRKDSNESLLRARTLVLGESEVEVEPKSPDPMKVEPEEPKASPAALGTPEQELLSSPSRPKVMESLCLVTPTEQLEGTTSKREKKVAAEKARKAAMKRSAKAKAKSRAKATSKQRRLRKTARVKASAKHAHNKAEAEQSDTEHAEPPAKKTRKNRKSPAVKAPCASKRTRSRTRAEANCSADEGKAKGKNCSSKKRKDKTSGKKGQQDASSPKSAKGKSAPKAKKTVDPEVAKARSRKSSAYCKARKEALAAGATEEEAKQRGKEVSLVFKVQSSSFYYIYLYFIVGGVGLFLQCTLHA